jgi:hypothetical protein
LGAKFESIGENPAPGTMRTSILDGAKRSPEGESFEESEFSSKAFDHPHQDTELFLFLVLEQKLAMHHPRSDVIASKVRKSAVRIGWNDESRGGHGGSLDWRNLGSKRLFVISAGN